LCWIIPFIWEFLLLSCWIISWEFFKIWKISWNPSVAVAQWSFSWQYQSWVYEGTTITNALHIQRSCSIQQVLSGEELPWICCVRLCTVS
jgi:hypothetical protein